jgi:hypothetical protein
LCQVVPGGCGYARMAREYRQISRHHTTARWRNPGEATFLLAAAQDPHLLGGCHPLRDRQLRLLPAGRCD